MLTKFSVENFKGFKKELVLDLSNIGAYDFSQGAVRNGNVNKAIIYGFNGEGKSNLGLAILDIASHLTDWNKSEKIYFPYLNLESDLECAKFNYEFAFPLGRVTYRYEKKSHEELCRETLIIDDNVVLDYDYQGHRGTIDLKGCENLQIENDSNNISRVKYIKSNAILDMDDYKNKLFKEFVEFVDKMLFFYSLQGNGYVGFKYGSENISNDIIHDNVKDFEDFLSNLGVRVNLDIKEVDGEKELMAVYKNGKGKKKVSFFRVASAGMKSLSLLYYWYIKMSKASFVFMDEFDAFYHFELAYKIVDLMTKFTNTQIVLTTHNTDLLTNDLLRPDCYYYLHDNKVKKLSECTEKDLRKAHNLQRLFKAHAFDV